jgi:hypothetical protein
MLWVHASEPPFGAKQDDSLFCLLDWQLTNLEDSYRLDVLQVPAAFQLQWAFLDHLRVETEKFSPLIIPLREFKLSGLKKAGITRAMSMNDGAQGVGCYRCYSVDVGFARPSLQERRMRSAIKEKWDSLPLGGRIIIIVIVIALLIWATR